MSLDIPKGEPLALIAGLWRYPVKGMRGEQVEELAVSSLGISGDRRYAIESSGAPAGKPLLTGRERAAMLLYRASTAEGRVLVKTPGGRIFDVEDPALLASMETELPQCNRLQLCHAEAPLTDCRPISLLSLQSVTGLSAEHGSPVDARRFRANLVLHFPDAHGTGFPEDSLVGRQICIGDTVAMRITERDPRCRIVTLDPETAEADPQLMKLLDRRHDGKLGVYATAAVSGRIRVGDPVVILPQE